MLGYLASQCFKLQKECFRLVAAFLSLVVPSNQSTPGRDLVVIKLHVTRIGFTRVLTCSNETDRVKNKEK